MYDTPIASVIWYLSLPVLIYITYLIISRVVKKYSKVLDDDNGNEGKTES